MGGISHMLSLKTSTLWQYPTFNMLKLKAEISKDTLDRTRQHKSSQNQSIGNI